MRYIWMEQFGTACLIEENICPECHRVKLRCEEQIFVWVDTSTGGGNILGHAIEDSHREHICRTLNSIDEICKAYWVLSHSNYII